MNIITYTADSVECLTPCPYDQKNSHTHLIFNVGSWGCYYCRYFVSHDIPNKTVTCKFPSNIELPIFREPLTQ